MDRSLIQPSTPGVKAVKLHPDFDFYAFYVCDDGRLLHGGTILREALRKAYLNVEVGHDGSITYTERHTGSRRTATPRPEEEPDLSEIDPEDRDFLERRVQERIPELGEERARLYVKRRHYELLYAASLFGYW